jgi:hypothetical protein
LNIKITPIFTFQIVSGKKSLDLPLGSQRAHLICFDYPMAGANCCEFVIITPIL